MATIEERYISLLTGHGDRYIGSLFRVDEPVPDDSCGCHWERIVEYPVLGSYLSIFHLRYKSYKKGRLQMLSYRTIEPNTLELLNKLSQLSILSDMRLVEGHWDRYT